MPVLKWILTLHLCLFFMLEKEETLETLEFPFLQVKKLHFKNYSILEMRYELVIFIF